jgi:serine/threonine-protein kinase HipA
VTAHCPLTYEDVPPGAVYSSRGLRQLAPKLSSLAPLPYTVDQLRQEAIKHASKLSIQGVQAKLSARLNVARGRFDLVDRGGRFILKPPAADYPELPANEDVTMRMAAAVGIEVPRHGLIYGADGALTYFIARFDRGARGAKLAVEDFAQLSGRERDTKYDASMESVTKVIDAYCTFPLLARRELFLRTVFCFLCGNEDMHLKNFSLITRGDVVSLAPAYDLLNTTIVLRGARLEELALSLRRKKRKLQFDDLITYFGRERLGLNEAVIRSVLTTLQQNLSGWHALLQRSFLSVDMRTRYADLLRSRAHRLGLMP